MTVNQSTWKKVVYEDCKAVEARQIENSGLKLDPRKHDSISVPDTLQSEHVCSINSVGSVSPKPDLLVIRDHMTANNRKLVLQKSFSSNSLETHFNTVTNYVGLQQV